MTDTTTNVTGDMQAEQSVLGAVMLQNSVLDDLTGIDAPDFYWPKHATIFAVMQKMAQAGDPIDPVTLSDALQATGALTNVGGPLYLHELLTGTPTASNAAYYARIIRDKAIRRRVHAAATKISQLAGSGDMQPDELVEMARTEIDSTGTATTEIVAIDSLIDPLLTSIEQGEAARIVAPTPWPELTEHTGGFRRGAVYVIGARPGVGKSIAAVQIGIELAKTGVVSFHSLEMGENEIAARVLANQARVALGRLNGTGEQPSSRDWEKLAKARATVGDIAGRIMIDDRSTVSVTDIRSHARTVLRQAQKNGQELNGIIIDYLQLMAAPRGIHPSTPRHEIVAGLSRSLKILARELDVPVILLSQLNRASTTTDRPPTMADLRESGAIEQDADVILLLHQENPPSPDIGMLLAKNRHGVASTVIELTRKGEFSALETRQWQPSYAGGA